QHDEAVAVARPEVDVRQPSPAAAAAPLDGEDDEVQRVARLDLDPCGAAAPGVVRGGEVLQYDALVPLVEDRAVEVGELVGVGADPAGDEGVLGDDVLQGGEPLAGGCRYQGGAVAVQQVEEVHRERHPAAGDLLCAGAGGRLLERAGAPAGVEGDGLAVEDEPPGGQGAHDLGDLRHPLGDVVQGAGEDGHLVVLAVHLHPDAVDLAVRG